MTNNFYDYYNPFTYTPIWYDYNYNNPYGNYPYGNYPYGNYLTDLNTFNQYVMMDRFFLPLTLFGIPEQYQATNFGINNYRNTQHFQNYVNNINFLIIGGFCLFKNPLYRDYMIEYPILKTDDIDIKISKNVLRTLYHHINLIYIASLHKIPEYHRSHYIS